ncbi:MAG: hypothetical protein J6X44_00750, partial [Thermoguttaceae bacterium]|nr:hypothetical protein [Thermoguttaceae bacterium]
MITIVVGKPGSGQSYHIVRHIAKYLTTLSKKETIERKIYTNVSLNLDELQAYFNRRAISIDVRSIVKLLEEADLKLDRDKLRPGDVKEEKRGNRLHTVVNPFSPAFFWNRFPDNALIVIDEIQKYIGSVKEYGESEEQSLVEYFSLHRHKKHDWIFLTQAITSLSVVVRRVSEKVIEVYNSKSTTLPFPFSIPVADIFTLLRGFGIENQVYRVRTGVLQGTYRVDFEGPIEVVKMSPEIFRLYQTHTLLGEDEKGASVVDSELPFDLGPGAWWRAILWFLGQHGFRFLILGSIFFGFTYGCLRVMGVDPFFWVKDIRLPFLSRR